MKYRTQTTEIEIYIAKRLIEKQTENHGLDPDKLRESPMSHQFDDRELHRKPIVDNSKGCRVIVRKSIKSSVNKLDSVKSSLKTS